MAAALAPAYAIAILLSGNPNQGCPSPRQLSDALTAHLPGMVLPLGHATGPATLRLSVATDASGAMRLALSDPAGAPLLHRWIAASGQNHGDCPALAETAALIVERYWHEVGYEVPVEAPPLPKPPPPKQAAVPPKPTPKPPPPKPVPTPPRPAPRVAVTAPPAGRARTSPRPPARSLTVPLPSPRWWLGAVGGARIVASGEAVAATQLALAVERPVLTQRIGLRLSIGAETGVAAKWSGGHASVRQFPIRMGAYWAIPLGFGRLEPGVGVDLNVISVSFVHAMASNLLFRATPGADVALGWALPLRHRIYVRALTDVTISVPLRVVTTSTNQTIFTTPRLAALLGIELGVWFP